MMKKILFIFCFAVLTLLLSGCGNPEAKKVNTNAQQSVADVLQQGMAAADKGNNDVRETNASVPEPTPAQVTPAPTPEVAVESLSAKAANTAEGIDVDMTQLSSTMIYAEVYSMMTNSKEYLGKKIRMRGDYSYFYDKHSGNYYFACLIRDATACCAQGIEFVLSDAYKFPDDYPASGDEITVTGTFESYLENNITYYHLVDAVYQ